MNDEQRRFIEQCRGMSDAELYEAFNRQFQKAMKEVHPDLKPPEEREKATQRAQELNRRRDEVNRLKRS